MKYYQERIETDSVIPARIYIGRAQGGNCHYPLHWHNNLEFDLVLSGRIKGKVNGRQVSAGEGEFFFVNSGDLHETDAEDNSKMNAITVLLSYDLLKEYCPDADAFSFDFSGKDAAKSTVKELLMECARLYTEREEFFELEISIVLRKICSVLLKECRMKKQAAGYGRSEQKNIINIKKAIDFMEKNYTEELSLQKVAAEIGMAPTYFSRFINKTTNETFYGYLTKIRLYHAYMELAGSDASITEIAMNNGFSNVKSFIGAFKKIYKITPAKYRKHLADSK